MSWFSALLPAALAPAPEPLSLDTLPIERLPATRTGPRPKTHAKRLPQWEAPSDDEDGGFDMDDASQSPVSNGSPTASRANRMNNFSGSRGGSLNSSIDGVDTKLDPFSTEDEKYTIRDMPPLQSYEEAVLSLKQPRSMSRSRFNTGTGTGDQIPDDSESTDEDTAKGQEHAAAAQEKLKHELKVREKLLEEEKFSKDQTRHLESVSGVNAISASKIIVGVAKVKLNMMRQKMKIYEDSERLGTEDSLRAKKLLVWTAGLSFLKKFQDKMEDPDIKEAKMKNYLKNLPPPPPPPPLEPPPNDEDEELHDKYEAMIRRYKKQWTDEGTKVLGQAKFEEIRNRTKDGPASKEKKIIAAKCLEEAGQVLNEDEYQELLRKAWRLRDDHAALSDYDPEAFAREVAKSSAWGPNKKA